MSSVRQALSTGMVLGALWGTFEAAWVVLGPWFAFSTRLVAPAPLDLGQTAQVVALGALFDAGLLMAFLLATLPLLALLRAPVDAQANGRRAARLGVGLIVFLNLYWHTKSQWAVTDGQPFHHPVRLAITAGFLVLAALSAWALVRPGWVGAPGRLTTRLVFVALLLAGGWGLWQENRVRSYHDVAAPEGAPNVLFVVVDALRADRLGVYGHERSPPVSPRVDELARQGIVFERAWAQAPFTWTSFGSFLTGKYPRQHGLIKMSPDLALDPRRNRTIAKALQDEGYATGAFMTGTLSNSTGLLDGFDTYFETIVGHDPVHRASKWSVARSRMLLFVFWNKLRQALDPELLNTEAKSWIREHADRPFFAFVHYYSTHTPFDPPNAHKDLYFEGTDSPYDHWYQSYAVQVQRAQREGKCHACAKPTWTCEHFDPERDVPRIDALYDAGAHYADTMTGELLDLLDELGVGDNTLVIFTSDHGEELYDHAVFEHDWMFETNLHVPLIVKLPGAQHAGTRVGWPVEMLDLPPTILDVVGAGELDTREPSPGAVTEALPDAGRGTRFHLRTPGRSLLPDMAGQDPGADEKVIFAENVRYIAVSDGTHKLIASRFAGERRFQRKDGARFFDHSSDPQELSPLWPDQPGFAEASAELRRLFALYDSAMPRADLGKRVVNSAEQRDMLQALAKLGYVGEGAALDLAVHGDSGEGSISEILGSTQLLGSNEMFEEDLYRWPHPWPPGREDL
ncbi:MAG: hypothetical protein DHS20C15_21500 [Planctomycetota bacterium]|nr:MAG: hypothetical protein DHS20C15_21500 [Planctomycetota bacterium]